MLGRQALRSHFTNAQRSETAIVPSCTDLVPAGRQRRSSRIDKEALCGLQLCEVDLKNAATVALLLSRAVISDHVANSSENIMRNRVPPLQNLKNPHAKWAAKPPFLVPFFKFWRGGTRFLIIFSKEFANLALIAAHDNSSHPYSNCPDIDYFRNIYAKNSLKI